MDHPAPQTILLKDYTPPAYLVDTVELRFELDPKATLVTSNFKVRRNPAHLGAAVMPLDGRELELVSVRVDGQVMRAGDFEHTSEALTLSDLSESASIESR